MPPKLRLKPITQREARAFITLHHRHNGAPQGDVIRVGLVDKDGELRAVGTAGRPISATLQDGYTLEITRVCTLGDANACSRVYGALAKAAKALGYKRVYTYTLASEPGTSARCAGFELDGDVRERDWSTESGYPRYAENLLGERITPSGPKHRWIRNL